MLPKKREISKSIYVLYTWSSLQIIYVLKDFFVSDRLTVKLIIYRFHFKTTFFFFILGEWEWYGFLWFFLKFILSFLCVTHVYCILFYFMLSWGKALLVIIIFNRCRTLDSGGMIWWSSRKNRQTDVASVSLQTWTGMFYN